MWGQLSTTCRNDTEVAQLEAPCCSQPQPATDNGVRDGKSNWLLAVIPLPTHGSAPWTQRNALCNAGHKLQDLLQPLGRERATIGMPSQRTACAVTQGVPLNRNNYRSTSPNLFSYIVAYIDKAVIERIRCVFGIIMKNIRVDYLFRKVFHFVIFCTDDVPLMMYRCCATTIYMILDNYKFVYHFFSNLVSDEL